MLNSAGALITGTMITMKRLELKNIHALIGTSTGLDSRQRAEKVMTSVCP